MKYNLAIAQVRNRKFATVDDEAGIDPVRMTVDGMDIHISDGIEINEEKLSAAVSEFVARINNGERLGKGVQNGAAENLEAAARASVINW